MLFIQTDVKEKIKDYSYLFEEIEKKLHLYGNLLLNNYKFGFESKLNHELFDDLINYREILKMKLDCGECFCDYSVSQIISKIKKLTNTIC